MKQHARILAILPVTGLITSAGYAADTIHILRDTPIELRLKRALSSATARVHDYVEFDIVEDVKAGNVVVIPRGSLAWGAVMEASPKSRMARNGRLEIDISTACLADGTRVALQAMSWNRGGSSAGPGSNESVLALPALPLLLFIYGKETNIPEGKSYTVKTAESLELDGARFAGKGPNRSCGPGGASAEIAPDVRTLSTLKVESAPSLAEIYVDGKYFGNTPARLRLSPGDHSIAVRIAGRKNWERILSLTPGGETSISALLEDTLPPATATRVGPERP